MSRWLRLAEEAPENSDTSTRHLTKPDNTRDGGGEGGFCPLLSNVKRQESENSAPVAVTSSPSPPARGPVPDHTSVGGRPVTWTGRVVSLEDWREMTDRERFGERPSGENLQKIGEILKGENHDET